MLPSIKRKKRRMKRRRGRRGKNEAFVVRSREAIVNMVIHANFLMMSKYDFSPIYVSLFCWYFCYNLLIYLNCHLSLFVFVSAILQRCDISKFHPFLKNRYNTWAVNIISF